MKTIFLGMTREHPCTLGMSTQLSLQPRSPTPYLWREFTIFGFFSHYLVIFKYHTITLFEYFVIIGYRTLKLLWCFLSTQSKYNSRWKNGNNLKYRVGMLLIWDFNIHQNWYSTKIFNLKFSLWRQVVIVTKTTISIYHNTIPL